MRRLFLAIVLLAFAMNANAQLNGVEIGYGPMGFPSLDGVTESPRGGAAFLNIMVEAKENVAVGGSLIIGGNSRIAFAGEDIGQGMVGLVGNAELRLGDRGRIRFGVFAGGAVFQTYERVDLTQGRFADPAAGFSNNQKLKDKNFQPYGGVKVGIGPISVSYAPAGNTIMVGVRLFNGN